MGLRALQTKIGVNSDGVFGPGTLKAAANFFGLTPQRAAHFFGQLSHESGGFTVFVENLNYSAAGLRSTWPTRFTEQTAKQFARKPEAIANLVYSNRMGNGNEASGDGWRFRGRGAIQLTGRANYQALADHLKRQDIMTNPDLVATEFAFESALFFFRRNNLWNICDRGINDAAITSLTKRINGGTIGLEDRISKTKQYFDWLK